MPLQLRHFRQILESWLSYVVSHSDLNDINPGSVLRTLGEAHSIEAALANVQIKTVQNLYSIDKAQGQDLDERARDYGLERLPATSARGTVNITDTQYPNPIVTTLYSNIAVGATSVVVPAASIAAFPATGAIVLNRAGNTRELLTYSAKNVGNNTLTLSQPSVNAHVAGESLYLSTVGQDRTLKVGLVVKTPAPETKFTVTTATTLYDGDSVANNVPVQSVGTGSNTNVQAGTLTLFDAPPFPTATVVNPAGCNGGDDRESDAELRERIRAQQANLTSATPAAIKAAAAKVELPSGQRVLTVNLQEPTTTGPATLYISDGTPTYTPTSQIITTIETAIQDAKAGQMRASLANWPVLPTSECLLVSRERGVASATGPGFLTDSTKQWTANQWAGWTLFDLSGNTYAVTGNNATSLLVANTITPANTTYALIQTNITPTYANGGSYLVNGTDYILNNSNGNFQLTQALVQHDRLIAYPCAPALQSYAYYDGLLQEVQRVINGDPSDPTDYPGVKAVGTVINVANPTIVTVNVQGIIIASQGVDPIGLRTPVVNAIMTYINALGIGDDVLFSHIVDAALSVQGVYDFVLQVPSSNVTILPSQIAKTVVTSVVVA